MAAEAQTLLAAIHNDVLQKLMRKARKGTQIIYIPGNHDEFLSSFLGSYGNVSILHQAFHTTATGETYVVVHGHEFDMVTRHAAWVSVLGDIGYQFLLELNRPVNWIRSLFGRAPWSLSAFVKQKTKLAVGFIGRFEEALVHFAKKHQTTGVICGHIHTPGYEYWNTGDWVESQSALVEHIDGRLELLLSQPEGT